MGKRARPGGNAISLFPFLAVLICAMGALILLLLVTTRRIRHQQLETAAAVVASAETTPTEAASAPLPLAEPAENALSETLPPPPPKPDPRDVPIEPLFAVDPPPPLPDPNDEWRERLQVLEAQHSRLVAVVAERQSTAARLRTTIDASSRAARDLETQQAEADQQMHDIEQALQQLQQQQSDCHRDAALLRRQIDEARERLADSSSKFAIIPYDGRGGTTRRPLIIECTDRAITFVSEGITLGPDDLEGFNSRYNPLLYATIALAEYWERTDRRRAVEEGTANHAVEPYVLLVVRPEGTTTYYRARKFLSRMEGSFGYELVCADQEFVWPESDETAIELCRSVIERMLSERESLMATIPGALSDEIGRMGDEAGRFRLDEVDEARRLSRRLTNSGQSSRREPGATWGADSLDLSRRRMPDSFGAGRVADTSTASENAVFKPGTRNRISTRRLTSNAAGGSGGTVGSEPADAAVIPPDALLGQNRPVSRGVGNSRLNQPSDGLSHGAADAEAGADLPSPAGTSFAEFAQNARMTSSGATEPADAPGPLDLTLRARDRTQPAAVGGQTRWSFRARSGAIGFEREVLVRVTAAQVSIADETAFMITEGLPPDELRRRFQLHLEHHIQSWGEPPRSFYWLPAIKFVVSPGGNQHYERLKAAAKAWELRTTVEHVLQ